MRIFESIQSKGLIDNMDKIEDDYTIMCKEFGRVINSYYISAETYSDTFWKYLLEKYTIDRDGDIINKTDVEIDEKNRLHKSYKYYVKCNVDKLNFFIITFFDESRAYSDDDYISCATEEDKKDKISNIMIYHDPAKITTSFLEETIVKDLLGLVYFPSKKDQFYTITTTQNGYNLNPSYVKNTDINIEMNYGKEFVELYDKICDKLTNKNHGLFLFHGESGTGKTHFIRKLISTLSEKKTIIYIPSYMMYSIGDPELLSFLSNFNNSILLLEDSENILTKDINDRSQAVSNILNITDGLLNDTLGIQIIATFNVEAKMIDSALTRAGRLIVNHKFGKLSVENANRLAEHIGNKIKFTRPVTLAEIYEGHNQILSEDKVDASKKIGFDFTTKK